MLYDIRAVVSIWLSRDFVSSLKSQTNPCDLRPALLPHT
jgi:hypothetical protein